MPVRLQVRAGRDGRLSAIDPAAPCTGCGCEPEIESYRVRTMTRVSDGEQVQVRVGYQCSCRAVTIDGLYTGTAS